MVKFIEKNKFIYIYINSGYCKCQRSDIGGKIKHKVKHVKEDRMQDLAPSTMVYIYIFNGVKCISYEKPRRSPAGLRQVLP